MIERPVQLRHSTWDWVRQRVGVEEQHPMLAVPYCVDPDEFERAGNAAREEVAQARVSESQLAPVMRLLAAPTRELNGYAGITDAPPVGFVAALGADDRGVIATRDRSTISLRPIYGDLCDAVYYTLPLPRRPVRPGPEIRVRRADYQQLIHPADDEDEPVTILQPVPSSRRSDSAIEQMSQLLHAPRSGSAQIYAGLRDRHGVRAASPVPVAVIDTEHHRWVVASRTEGVQQWMVATPATQPVLRHYLSALFEQVKPLEMSGR